MNKPDVVTRPPFPPYTAFVAPSGTGQDRRDDGGDLVSYRTLRRVVGVLGVILPIVLALWGFFLTHPASLLPSISDYYSLRTRDAFVGVLFTIAWFLFTYRGFDWRDNLAGNLACLFALCVALFPNSGTTFEKVVHFTAAALLFVVLACFALFLFTRTSGVMTREKVLRNRVYRTCGVLMVACIVSIAAAKLLLTDQVLDRYSVVFWLESLALWAFGASWFVKGETVLRDAPPPST
jgi:hypothetical protein